MVHMIPEKLSTYSDEVLLKHFVESRDELAFSELVRRYQHFAYRIALARCKRIEHAEDIVQEAFFKLTSRHMTASLKGFPSFKAWFFGFVGNIARSRDRAEYRLRSREQHVREKAMRNPHDAEYTVADTSSDELSCVLEKAISNLDESLKLPLILHYIENLSQHEISRLMQLSQPAVARRIKKGLELLRIHLIQAGFSASNTTILGLLSAPQLLNAPPGLQCILTNPQFLRNATLSQESLRLAPCRGSRWRGGATPIAWIALVALIAACGCLWIYFGSSSANLRANSPAESEQFRLADAKPAASTKVHYYWSFANGPAPDLTSKKGDWNWVPQNGSRPSGMSTDARAATVVRLPLNSTKGKLWKISVTGFPFTGVKMFMRGGHAMPDGRNEYTFWNLPVVADAALTWTDTFVQDGVEVVAIYQGLRDNLISAEILQKETTTDELNLTVRGYIIREIEVREIDQSDIPEKFLEPNKLIKDMKLQRREQNDDTSKSRR